MQFLAESVSLYWAGNRGKVGGAFMFEGLLQPMHLLVGFVLLIPVFLICRWLWRVGSKRKPGA
jgi:hypothetical protein